MFVVGVVHQIVVKEVDTVTQRQEAALQYGNSFFGLWVAGDDSELLTHSTKLPRVNEHSVGFFVIVGKLGKHDGSALFVADPFGGQFVMREFLGHGGGLSVNQVCK